MKLVDVYQGSGILPDAIEFLYELMRERPAEANISHTELPPIEKHRQFVHRRPYRAWMIAQTDAGVWVGAVYLTNRNEVGVFVKSEHRRKGYGAEALIEILKKFEPLTGVASVRPGKFVANVAPGNEASQRLFGEKLGAKLIQLTYEL